MKAILMTRCGCERTFEVTFPAPPKIIISLCGREPDLSFSKLPPDMPEDPIKTRTFILQEVGNISGNAYYLESSHA